MEAREKRSVLDFGRPVKVYYHIKKLESIGLVSIFRQVQKLFEPYERKRSDKEVKPYNLFLALGAEKSEPDAQKDSPKKEKDSQS